MEMNNVSDAIDLICKNQNICLCEKSLRIISIVNSNFAEYDMSLRFIKNRIGLSDTQIHEYCRTRLQTTPGNLISFIRLYNCLKKLKFTDECIFSIGVNCGYKNLKTFRNNIHKTFNLSPSDLLYEIRLSPTRNKNYQYYLKHLIKQNFFY